MSRCHTECDSFYKNPNETTFNSQGPSGDNMSCSYCLSNDLEVNTGTYIDLECDCAKQLSNMENDKNITFDQYNQIKQCLQKQGCSNSCKTLYNEILGSGCSGNTQLATIAATTGSSNTVSIILGVVFGGLALLALIMLIKNLSRKSGYTTIPSSVRY